MKSASAYLDENKRWGTGLLVRLCLLFRVKNGFVSREIDKAYKKSDALFFDALLDNGDLLDATQVKRSDIADFHSIHFAAVNGHRGVVKFLIRNGVSVSAEAKNGYQAIHFAALNGHTNLVEFLIRKGADINTETTDGDPIHFAAQAGHTDVIKLLLTAGVKVDEPDIDGDQPIHFAAHRGQVEVIKLLLASGAKIDAVNTSSDHGTQPLFLAAAKGFIDTVRFLLAQGANVNAQNPDGSQAIDAAKESGHMDIVKLFLDSGAKET